MSKLYRLVYTSARKPECTEEEIDNILASCKKNNPQRNVTGVLVHSDKRFLQYVEGSEDDLMELYNIIKADSRHAGCSIRCKEPIEERAFSTWEMGFKDMDKSISFKTSVTSENRKKMEEYISGDIDFSDKGMKLLKLFFNV